MKQAGWLTGQHRLFPHKGQPKERTSEGSLPKEPSTFISTNLKGKIIINCVGNVITLQLQKTKAVEAQRVLVRLREAGLLRNFPMQFRDRKKRTGKELGQKPHVIISSSVTTNFHSFQLSKMPEPKLSKEQRVKLLIRQKNQDQAF